MNISNVYFYVIVSMTISTGVSAMHYEARMLYEDRKAQEQTVPQSKDMVKYNAQSTCKKVPHVYTSKSKLIARIKRHFSNN